MKVKVWLKNNQQYLATDCEVADTAFTRMRGLLGRQSLLEGQGLWIRPCNNIHMWFMRFSIDVVFIRSFEGNFKVTSAHAGVPAWKALPLFDLRAKDVLELPVGTIARLDLKPGAIVCIS